MEVDADARIKMGLYERLPKSIRDVLKEHSFDLVEIVNAFDKSGEDNTLELLEFNVKIIEKRREDRLRSI